jgi:CheY-like chemotaxis protein
MDGRWGGRRCCKAWPEANDLDRQDAKVRHLTAYRKFSYLTASHKLGKPNPKFGNRGCLTVVARGQSMTLSEQSGATKNRKPTILIVEDNDQIRALLCEILELSGYTVRLARDGVTALEDLNVEIPDVVLSDLYMPRMSGFELLSIVRRQFPMMRVIAMSSAFSGNGVPTGVTADAFYPKSSKIDDLLEIVEAMAYPKTSQLHSIHLTCATQK